VSIALVTCPACAGTGYGKQVPVCDVCLGSLHIAVDLSRDGSLPDGYKLWREWELGPVRPNPYRLTYETQAQGR
jgi:hypothetical protein